MHIEVGAFDAKAKLSELLREVKLGNSYTITQRSHPVADLVSTTSAVGYNADEAVELMRSIRNILTPHIKMINLIHDNLFEHQRRNSCPIIVANGVLFFLASGKKLAIRDEKAVKILEKIALLAIIHIIFGGTYHYKYSTKKTIYVEKNSCIA